MMKLDKPTDNENKEVAARRVRTNAYKIGGRLIALFAISAILTSLLGKWLDKQFNIEPYGTVAMLLIGFVVTWIITFKIYIQTTREITKISKQSEEENQ